MYTWEHRRLLGGNRLELHLYQCLTYKGFDLLTGLNNYLTEVLTTSYVFPKSATIKCHKELYPIKTLNLLGIQVHGSVHDTIYFVPNFKGFTGLPYLIIMFCKYENDIISRKFSKQRKK